MWHSRSAGCGRSSVSGDEIVWMRGFPVPAQLRAKPGREAILILDERSLA